MYTDKLAGAERVKLGTYTVQSHTCTIITNYIVVYK